MKYGKRLQCLMQDSLPEWRDKFINYKSLKKSINLIYGPDGTGVPLGIHYRRMLCRTGNECLKIAQFSRNLTKEEAGFFHLLNTELAKVNSFFIEKEEEFIIRLQEIKARLWGLHASNHEHESKDRNVLLMDEEKRIINGKEIVRIHGEMVLLVNYSALNYTGLAKILKKHDKRTGSSLRIPFIQSVLREPFFATEMVSRLMGECEEYLRVLFLHPSRTAESSGPSSSPSSLMVNLPDDDSDNGNETMMMHVPPRAAGQHDDHIVEGICKNIEAAWSMMKECRRNGSSTYNFFSFPPFSFTHTELDEEGLLTDAAASYGQYVHHGHHQNNKLITLPV